MTSDTESILTNIPPFGQTLESHGLSLVREKPNLCQVNLGLRCNQACRHCHLSAGPDRPELMSLETMEQVMDFMARCELTCLDITGGAPELNPHLKDLIRMAGSQGVRLMLRCNLSALYQGGDTELTDLMVRHRINVIASLPALNTGQTDAQRGKGSFTTSLEALGMLNRLGYGDPGTGLVLDLVSNPSGAFMPPDQQAAETRFRRVLADKWGIRFNHLFTFANMPLGRFKRWLERSDNYAAYLKMLWERFNGCTVAGLMCRSMVSVSWDGYLYDCDFNQAAGLGLGNRRLHITQTDSASVSGLAVATGQHCYACTAGAGFS